MPRRAKVDAGDLLTETLHLLRAELRRLKRAQKAPACDKCLRQSGLSDEEVKHLVRMTDTIRQVERDANAPWSPDKLKKLSDAAIEEEIRELEEQTARVLKGRPADA